MELRKWKENDNLHVFLHLGLSLVFVNELEFCCEDRSIVLPLICSADSSAVS